MRFLKLVQVNGDTDDLHRTANEIPDARVMTHSREGFEGMMYVDRFLFVPVPDLGPVDSSTYIRVANDSGLATYRLGSGRVLYPAPELPDGANLPTPRSAYWEGDTSDYGPWGIG